MNYKKIGLQKRCKSTKSQFFCNFIKLEFHLRLKIFWESLVIIKAICETINESNDLPTSATGGVSPQNSIMSIQTLRLKLNLKIDNVYLISTI